MLQRPRPHQVAAEPVVRPRRLPNMPSNQVVRAEEEAAQEEAEVAEYRPQSQRGSCSSSWSRERDGRDEPLEEQKKREQ